MLRFIVTLFIILLCSQTVNAFDFKFENAIKKSEITVDDLVTFLDLDYHKYSVLIEEGTEVSIVFSDVKKGKNVFNHKIAVDRNGEYVIRLFFTKYDDSIGYALTKEHKTINYSLNWNQESVFSGTITNPLSRYEHIYGISDTLEYGKPIGEKTVLRSFYDYDEKIDKEELVAEIYISTKRRD